MSMFLFFKFFKYYFVAVVVVVVVAESSRSRAIRLHSNVDHLGDGAVQRRVQRAAAAAAVNNKTDAPASHLAKNATKAAGISVASTSPGTITTSVYYLLPRNYFSKPIKSGAMAMVSQLFCANCTNLLVHLFNATFFPWR